MATDGGYIYAVGGDSTGVRLASVEKAAINTDGTLGPWSFTSTLNAKRSVPGVVANNGYLYAIGGWDGTHYSSVEYAQITVPDTTPPEVECSVDPAILSPSNHKMVDVIVDIEATDDLSETVTLIGVFASSNEPDNGVADGNTTGDVHGEDGFVADVDVTEVFAFVPEDGVYRGVIQLRAECAGNGNGRIYTIEAFVSDETGNVGSATCEVVVPHDKRRKN